MMKKTDYLFSATPQYGAQPLSEFLEWVQELTAHLDAEERASVTIEIGTYSEYGQAYAELVIAYQREKTPDEIAQEEAEVAAKKRAKEDDERRTLAALQAKYGAKAPQ